VWELRLRFPKVISPASRGGDDPRSLALLVRSVVVRELEVFAEGSA
jgi:hypothetical protein